MRLLVVKVINHLGAELWKFSRSKKIMHITPTSLSVGQLLGQVSERYVIPPYQRRYSWLEKQIAELIDDITLLEGQDTHLLGSVVCLVGTHSADLNDLEVVDGQQRLITMSILLLCLRERFAVEGQAEISISSDIDKLLVAKSISGQTSAKIKLDSIDAKDYAVLAEKGADVQNKCLAHAFSMVRNWVNEQSLKALKVFLYRLTNQAIVIRLGVSQAKDAFKLFETINNRGLRLSHTDIIKNFLLGNAARFDPSHLTLTRICWAKLVVNLDGTNSDTFFRYYLTAVTNKRIIASKVISQFKLLFHTGVKEAEGLPERRLYDDSVEITQDEGEMIEETVSPVTELKLEEHARRKTVSFKKFVDTLINYSKVYGHLVRADTGDEKIDRHLSNLKMIKAVQTYGFLMHLRVNGCTDQDLRSVLKRTESFILRRHICKERANETEALFASMCAIDPTAPLPATSTYYGGLCPSDEKFKEDFATTSFPANLIDRARYCLEQIELAMHGDHAEFEILGGDDVHVEHIIPQKIKTHLARDQFGDWVEYLGPNAEVRHQRHVSRIGNLTLFAGALNIGASNNPFARKKHAYRQSGLKLTKELCTMSHFKFAQVDKRSEALAEVAVKLWPKA